MSASPSLRLATRIRQQYWCGCGGAGPFCSRARALLAKQPSGFGTCLVRPPACSRGSAERAVVMQVRRSVSPASPCALGLSEYC